nr:hypothetical protein Itr_chr14CG12950 [Ipomoea trifida]
MRVGEGGSNQIIIRGKLNINFSPVKKIIYHCWTKVIPVPPQENIVKVITISIHSGFSQIRIKLSSDQITVRTNICNCLEKVLRTQKINQITAGSKIFHINVSLKKQRSVSINRPSSLHTFVQQNRQRETRGFLETVRNRNLTSRGCRNDTISKLSLTLSNFEHREKDDGTWKFNEPEERTCLSEAKSEEAPETGNARFDVVTPVEADETTKASVFERF